MSWENYHDVMQQVTSHGLMVEHLEVGTHKPKRCKVAGDREKRGWYWLTDISIDGKQYIVGSYGIWHGTANGAIKVALNKEAKALTAEQKAAMKARHKEQAARAKAMRATEAAKAAAQAAAAWRAYLTTGTSQYLERKGVGAHGVRFSPTGNGTIMVPMQDATGKIHGVQVIRSSGRKEREKEYWPRGLAKQGHYHVLGTVVPGAVVLLAEGYATAASLYEATGLATVVAFDANNLMPVAQALVKSHRGLRVLVCADDDYLTTGNPGVTAAQNAAMAVGGAWVKPDFPSDRGAKKLTDFNDLQHFPDGGQHLIRVQVEQAIAKAGWTAAKTAPAAVATTQGGGDDARRSAVSVMQIDDLVERFVPLDDGTGRLVFDTWARRIAIKDQMMALAPPRTRMDDIKAHPVWVRRGAYYLDQVGFDPAGEDENCKLNTWGGWPTKPKEGRCDKLLDLLMHLCSGETNSQELFVWLMLWLAYPIQHPGAKMQSAVVVHGPQGTGKSRFFEAVAKIYGEYGILLNQGAIEDKFNSDWTSRKLFVLADEIVARQDMYHLKNQLKALITGDWVRVNPKNVAAYKERNHLNIVFLSNEKQPVILENDDRRHCVIWTPEKLDESYYASVSEEIDNGGIEALHHALLTLDLGDFKPWTKPPMTRAKRELIDLNKDSVEVFLDEWQAGYLDIPFCPCKSSSLYQAYSAWCRRTGERFPRNDRQFMAHVEKLPGWQRIVKKLYKNHHYSGQTHTFRIIVPSVKDMETSAKEGADMRWSEASQTETQWMTDCVLAFENAMSVGDE